MLANTPIVNFDKIWQDLLILKFVLLRVLRHHNRMPL